MNYIIADPDKQCPSSKTIFLSGHEEYAVDAFEYAADGFLLIPFDQGEIKH